MICPKCKEQVDTTKEHVVLTHVLNDKSELTYHWHWPHYLEAGGDREPKKQGSS